MLQIQLFGEFQLTNNAAPVTALQQTRLQALLAYLLLHRHAPQSRQHLAFLFWPDSSEAQARANLRHLLHDLHHRLPNAKHFLVSDNKTVQWNQVTPYTLDVADFENHLAGADAAKKNGDQPAVAAALAAAVDLYGGDLLPACYDDWILPERERWRERFTTALEKLLLLLEAQHTYDQAIRYAQRLLRHDPLHESTYRHLMRLYALQGDRASALRIYHTCVTVLQRELGVEPHPATEETYTRLLNLDTTPLATVRSSLATMPLVGRQVEWGRLQIAWRQATMGAPHFVLVAGEAGIGKTRLVEELLHWSEQQGIRAARTRSYAAEGALAYVPVVEWLRSEAIQPTLSKLDPIWRSEIARLLPELLLQAPQLPPPPPLQERWQQQRFFEAMARAFLQVKQPLLLVLDDLQWCDAETLEWLHFLLRFDAHAPLLLVGTARLEELDDQHPLTALLLDLRTAGQVTEFELAPLSRAETGLLATHIAQQTITAEHSHELYQATQGNPLFVAEMVRADLHRGETREQEAGKPNRRSGLPPKVQAVIETRLRQLSPAARSLADLAAVIGQAFTFDLLARASGSAEEALLRSFDELWKRRIIREQRTNTYDFSHDRIREVAYATSTPAQRTVQHRRVAQALEQIYATDLDAVSAQLAVHYERAGMVERAITYYQRAAEVVRRTYANMEAIAYLNQGLALLNNTSYPESARLERALRELALQISLGPPLIAARGFAAAEVEKTYARARELCEQVGEVSQLFPVLFGLWVCYCTRADYQRALMLGEDLLHMAQDKDDSALLLQANHAQWTTLYCLGEFATVRAHCEQGIGIYDSKQHFSLTFHYGGHDAGVCCRNFAGPALWFLGYPTQALQQNQAGLQMAESLSHPFSFALALYWIAVVHQLRREWEAAQAKASAAVRLASEQGFPLVVGWASGVWGWALVEQGQVETGIRRIRQGLAAYRATGAAMDQTHLLALLAEAHGSAGQSTEGLGVLDEALTSVDRTGERYYAAELQRLKGELLLLSEIQSPNLSLQDEAEACFRQAIVIAHIQKAKSLELRAVMSLSRLWQRQGKREQALQMLAEIYGWFTEGFDTVDLQAAKSLLDELSS